MPATWTGGPSVGSGENPMRSNRPSTGSRSSQGTNTETSTSLVMRGSA